VTRIRSALLFLTQADLRAEGDTYLYPLQDFIEERDRLRLA
jgi:hypothetical protein